MVTVLEKVETEYVLMQFKSAFPLWDDDKTKLFDAKGNPVRTDIGWGSRCRVAFTLSPYDQGGNTGVTRYIYGIQIIDLVTGSTTAESCGFGEEEGFVAQDKPQLSEDEKQRAIEAGEIAWDE